MPRTIVSSLIALVALATLTACTPVPACISAQQSATIEQMAQIKSMVRTHTVLGVIPGTSEAFQHTLVKLRLKDGRVALCHITNEQAQLFRVGEIIRGPWGSPDG